MHSRLMDYVYSIFTDNKPFCFLLKSLATFTSPISSKAKISFLKVALRSVLSHVLNIVLLQALLSFGSFVCMTFSSYSFIPNFSPRENQSTIGILFSSVIVGICWLVFSCFLSAKIFQPYQNMCHSLCTTTVCHNKCNKYKAILIHMQFVLPDLTNTIFIP